MNDSERNAIKDTRAHWERMIGLDEEPKERDWTKPIRQAGQGVFTNAASLSKEMKLYVVQTETSSGPRLGIFDEYGKEITFDRVETGPRIIENVPEEPEYIPLDMGDRLTIDGQEYMVVRPGGYCSLINLNTGRARARSVKVEGRIDLSTCKAILGNRADQWREIYRTVRRCGS